MPRPENSNASTKRFTPATSMPCARPSTTRPRAQRPHAGHDRLVPGLRDLSQPARVHPDAARHRRRSECAGRRWVSDADRGAVLHAGGAGDDAAIGRRRHHPPAAGVWRGSESARHQRLHAAPHGGGRAQRHGGPDPSRRRRRSGIAHADRRLRHAGRDGGSSRAGDLAAMLARRGQPCGSACDRV